VVGAVQLFLLLLAHKTAPYGLFALRSVPPQRGGLGGCGFCFRLLLARISYTLRSRLRVTFYVSFVGAKRHLLSAICHSPTWLEQYSSKGAKGVFGGFVRSTQAFLFLLAQELELGGLLGLVAECLEVFRIGVGLHGDFSFGVSRLLDINVKDD
jgi:hypothetical protein